MDYNRENCRKGRENMIVTQAEVDRGFACLLEGSWDRAEEIFTELLEREPDNGMCCLGRAMAGKAPAQPPGAGPELGADG